MWAAWSRLAAREGDMGALSDEELLDGVTFRLDGGGEDPSLMRRRMEAALLAARVGTFFAGLEALAAEHGLAGFELDAPRAAGEVSLVNLATPVAGPGGEKGANAARKAMGGLRTRTATVRDDIREMLGLMRSGSLGKKMFMAAGELGRTGRLTAMGASGAAAMAEARELDGAVEEGSGRAVTMKL